jgi:RNA recognition motif-containing protein
MIDMRTAPFRGNIVVTNMPENFTGSALAALFDDFGLVIGAVIERPNGDEARALRGLVSLAPPSAVEAAIQSLDGRVIDSRHLKVRKAPEPKKKAPGARSSGAKPSSAARRPARPPAARAAAPAYEQAPVVVRRAPIVERRSLGGPGYKRVRFFDESKNNRGG